MDYIKMLSVIFLFVASLGCLIITGVDLLREVQIPMIVQTVDATAISVSLTLAGFTHGFTIGVQTPTPPTK